MNTAALLAAEGPNGIFFPGDINEFYWGSLAFLVVVAFLAIKVLPAVRKMMRSNTEKIANELEAAETAKTESQQRAEELRRQLGDIDQKKAEMRSEAEAAAASLEAEILARAESEAQEIKERGDAEVELMRSQAAADLQQEVGSWVAGAAQAVIEEALSSDQTTQGELVEDYINRDLRQLAQMS